MQMPLSAPQRGGFSLSLPVSESLREEITNGETEALRAEPTGLRSGTWEEVNPDEDADLLRTVLCIPPGLGCSAIPRRKLGLRI